MRSSIHQELQQGEGAIGYNPRQKYSSQCLIYSEGRGHRAARTTDTNERARIKASKAGRLMIYSPEQGVSRGRSGHLGKFNTLRTACNQPVGNAALWLLYLRTTRGPFRTRTLPARKVPASTLLRLEVLAHFAEPSLSSRGSGLFADTTLPWWRCRATPYYTRWLRAMEQFGVHEIFQ
eukprot:scaffold274053_cov28-Tisochrysis_lutea.AAC.3